MRRIAFSLIVALAAFTGPAALADKQQPALDIPEHGLGLLLETPNSPVGDLYGERPVLT
ncbi:MAG: hypothetical protein AAGA00_10790 [Pseudomonadota bacterium]